ncbi:MAG: hypothetical protein H8Z69_02575 [Nanohaloarchaea archaeon]|nr:hypothetical protein [Candidatus Nanohaloarchaea archaeon]
MDITEEAVRRRQTIILEDPESAYPELKDLLERRMSFDKVVEEKYYHDIDEGTVRSRINAVEEFDTHTVMELEIFLVIRKDSRELDVQVKGSLVTHYPMEGWKDNLWYYAYRALYDKFLYGEVRHEWEHAVEEKVEELMTRLRQTVET